MDPALWRRLVIVPFNYRFPDAQKDPGWKDRILKEEGPGILNWIIEGARAYLENGLLVPEPIVDFILQHHGTTLVEYFYREAARRSEENPNGESVSDKDFRYPGPKPQTLEAAVMMLADTVESASRTLVDPTPARIRGLVDSIAQKKVADGQFDECGLTFKQLDRVRQSLVKSLTAIYHARVKYPGQQSA